MKVLCVFGKYQYGDTSRGINTEYAAFVPALKKLGHEVIHFESWDMSTYVSFAEMNQSLLETVEKVKPDVMLTVQMHYEIWLETLKIIQARGDVATISWTTDDSWKYIQVSRFIGGAYHAMTTTYPDVVNKYHQDRIQNVLLSQWAASSDSFNEPLSFKLCQYPVSFVGRAFGSRNKRIAQLQKSGIEVASFGYGWSSGSIPAEEIPRIMRESVISLNFANSIGENQIKARTFEVPGAGGFLLTEYAPGLEKYYNLGKEIEIFHNIPELIEKINYYLAHAEERDAIAWAGFERTKREHNYEIRMKEVLDFAIKSKENWLKSNSIQLQKPSFNEALQAHKLNFILKTISCILLWISIIIFGKQKGRKAARRISYEISWRLCKQTTFTASGWPGRMFPKY
ncbi:MULTISPECIES: CgeB family protein [Calothrix]|uniref:Glycosyltransferase family 1 protein n=2 Tax=Calothrix TaxID=1186 RepID=A0ABR8ACY7_9CYAN|nr:MULTISPECIES: glycosyltransferase [Calothrix]MBD2197806.1 glycosyltransferase family 1 protein [Calothrix parietina FACHB-288]MBD2226210.1 glycosyltransferase family 1 protein [Calothrix anomala FACHB-343]